MADYRDRAHYHLDDSGNGSIHTANKNVFSDYGIFNLYDCF